MTFEAWRADRRARQLAEKCSIRPVRLGTLAFSGAWVGLTACRSVESAGTVDLVN